MENVDARVHAYLVGRGLDGAVAQDGHFGVGILLACLVYYLVVETEEAVRQDRTLALLERVLGIQGTAKVAHADVAGPIVHAQAHGGGA